MTEWEEMLVLACGWNLPYKQTGSALLRDFHQLHISGKPPQVSFIFI